MTTNAEATAGVAGQAFIGINNPAVSGTNNPVAFAGPYSGGGFMGNYEPLLGKLALSGQISVSQDKAWTVYGLGAGAAVGPAGGAFAGGGVGYEQHVGTTRLLNPRLAQPAKKVSWMGLNTSNFAYTYDKLNRLISGASDDNYKERGITYDAMGNIKTLNRYQAGTLIDSLLYTYTGNQPGTISDRSTFVSTTDMVPGSTAYLYDGNGSVKSSTNTITTRANKSYTYNLLNLPQVITVPAGTVTYTYDATGRKLRKVTVNGASTNTTEYIDGIQYLNSTTAIDFIATEEGRADVNGAGYDYQYCMGDNLGNTRKTFSTLGGKITPLQTDDYYPFGQEINTFVSSPKNEYLYNGKELQEELTQYDYNHRFYDPVIGRFTTIDPKAEAFEHLSGYNYAENNPIRNIDPDGMATTDAQGNTLITDPAEIAAFVQQVKAQQPKQDDDPKAKAAKAAQDKKDKEAADKKKKEDDDDPISSKISRYTNYAAAGTIVIGLGPEDPAADAVAGGEELLGQTTAGLFKLGELAVDLWTTLNFAEHTKNKRGSTKQKHTARRSGKTYDKSQNNKRGEKNKKFKPSPNPNKTGN